MSEEINVKPIVIPDEDIHIFNSIFGAIRCTVIGGTPYMIGKDVATCLGYVNIKDALLKYIPDDEKLKSQITTSGQRRYMIFITESGLYRLAFGSKMPKDKEFTDWVVKEVLPSIRKHGEYVIKEEEQAEPALAVMNITNPRAYIHASIDYLCQNSGCTYTSAWLLFRHLVSNKFNLDYTVRKHELELIANTSISILDILESDCRLYEALPLAYDMASNKDYEQMFIMYGIDMHIPDKNYNQFQIQYGSINNKIGNGIRKRYIEGNRNDISGILNRMGTPAKVITTPFSIMDGFLQ